MAGVDLLCVFASYNLSVHTQDVCTYQVWPHAHWYVCACISRRRLSYCEIGVLLNVALYGVCLVALQLMHRSLFPVQVMATQVARVLF